MLKTAAENKSNPQAQPGNFSPSRKPSLSTLTAGYGLIAPRMAPLVSDAFPQRRGAGAEVG